MPKMVGEDTSQTLTNKTIDGDDNTITDAAPAAHTHLLAAGATDVTATATELNYVDGVTSAIQTQLDAKAAKSSNLSDLANAGTARTNLGVGTSDSPQFTGINIGHASDTTVTRTGAGDIAVEGNGIYRAGGTDVPLADGGTGASLVDPNADRILFWDDSAGAMTWLSPGTNLTITGTTIDASGGGGTVEYMAASRSSALSLPNGDPFDFVFNRQDTAPTAGSYSTSTGYYTAASSGGAGWYEVTVAVDVTSDTARLDIYLQSTGTGASGRQRMGVDTSGLKGFARTYKGVCYVPNSGTVYVSGYSGATNSAKGGNFGDADICRLFIRKVS